MRRYSLFVVFAAVFLLLPVWAAEPATAVVEIILPANAKLYLGDDLIRSKPGTHRLDTPPLERGKTYTYEFRLEIERDGKTETFKRSIDVKAGETSKADFTDLVKAPAKPDLPKPEEKKDAGSPKPPPDKSKPDKPDKPAANEFKMSDLERDIVDRTNAERKKKDLPELKPNPKLFAAARGHSEHMARLDKLAHELEGSKLPDRVKEAGYPGFYVGENAAAGLMNAEEVVNGWMNSEGHRRNILDGKYTEIGIGIAKASNGTLYFTQVFGKPGR
jgi:uncharacterized protein (TIGR03000 family)